MSVQDGDPRPGQSEVTSDVTEPVVPVPPETSSHVCSHDDIYLDAASSTVSNHLIESSEIQITEPDLGYKLGNKKAAHLLPESR